MLIDDALKLAPARCKHPAALQDLDLIPECASELSVTLHNGLSLHATNTQQAASDHWKTAEVTALKNPARPEPRSATSTYAYRRLGFAFCLLPDSMAARLAILRSHSRS